MESQKTAAKGAAPQMFTAIKPLMIDCWRAGGCHSAPDSVRSQCPLVAALAVTVPSSVRPEHPESVTQVLYKNIDVGGEGHFWVFGD